MFSIILYGDAKGKGEKMIIYDLTVERQNLIGADKFTIAAEANKTVGFRFHFDRSWRIFDTKAAVFKNSRGKYYVLEIKANCVSVPWEVLRDDKGFELAVVAYENEVVLTSKKVRVSVSQSLLPEVCRQLSPTATLFDTMKSQLREELLSEYRSEIQALNRTHADELRRLGEQLEAEKAHTAEVTAQKDAQIAQLNYAASVTENEHTAELAELNNALAQKTRMAENWELIDTALSKKTNVSHTLWVGGTERFALPELNTSSIINFTNIGISGNLTEVGFDVSSATSLENLFYTKQNIKSFKIKNSENITSIVGIASGCRSLEEADLGNLVLVNQISDAFNNCTSLRTIHIGNAQRITTITSAFYNCRSLQTIDGTLGTFLCTTFQGTFTNCSMLRDIRFADSSIKFNIDFSSCINLSMDSIYSIANGLSATNPATVTFAAYAFNNSLSAREREEITDIISTTKGWTLRTA